MQCQISHCSFKEIQCVNTAKGLGPLRLATENLAHKLHSFAHHCTFQDHLMQSAEEQDFTVSSFCRPAYWCGEKEIEGCVESVV